MQSERDYKGIRVSIRNYLLLPTMYLKWQNKIHNNHNNDDRDTAQENVAKGLYVCVCLCRCSKQEVDDSMQRVWNRHRRPIDSVNKLGNCRQIKFIYKYIATLSLHSHTSSLYTDAYVYIFWSYCEQIGILFEIIFLKNPPFERPFTIKFIVAEQRSRPNERTGARTDQALGGPTAHWQCQAAGQWFFNSERSGDFPEVSVIIMGITNLVGKIANNEVNVTRRPHNEGIWIGTADDFFIKNLGTRTLNFILFGYELNKIVLFWIIDRSFSSGHKTKHSMTFRNNTNFASFKQFQTYFHSQTNIELWKCNRYKVIELLWWTR